MGIASAYPSFQERLILREGLLVAFFLAGLVVLGGQQAWWLQPLLQDMDATTVYFGATALTAITDNAALTYLGSLVEGLSDEFKYALVAGAVTGGGLTVIANAPNPAGFSILRRHFNDGAVNPLGLLVSALPPRWSPFLLSSYCNHPQPGPIVLTAILILKNNANSSHFFKMSRPCTFAYAMPSPTDKSGSRPERRT